LTKTKSAAAFWKGLSMPGQPQGMLRKTNKHPEGQEYLPTSPNATESTGNISSYTFPVSIDQTQAQLIASAIYSDIAAYVAEHQAEYEQYLQNERETQNDN
jgi:hypothetical protein